MATSLLVSARTEFHSFIWVKKPLRLSATQPADVRVSVDDEDRMTRAALPRLLLIDDEPALAAYLADAARLSGYEPVTAHNEVEFEALLASARADMVAIDLGMPGMDGVELLRLLADEKFAGPVLIISGFDRRILESAFRLGQTLGLNMTGPLEKPTRLEDIERLLASLKPQLVQS